MDQDAVHVGRGLAIPLAEIEVRASRAGGPGGQHVNTSSSRIEAVWNVRSSRVLSDEQRARLLVRLASRLDGEGQLRVVSQEHRSQLRNRDAALARLGDVVRRALVVPRARKATRPTRASKERRLDQKRKRGSVKRDRRRPGPEE
jgi:ribosome-associated protein